MTTTDTTASASLDAALTKIDALLASQTGVSSMTQPEFATHVASELEKALADAAAGKAELSKARLEHLKAQTATAKAVFDTGATLASITMFKDPWQTVPGSTTSKTADVPQPALGGPGSDGVAYKEDVLFVTTTKGREPSPLLKALCFVAKAKPALALKTAGVAKADSATIVAKAGEAKAMLDHIATMFGITVESPDEVLEYEFKWDIADTISALQSAAKLETMLAQMSAAMPAAVMGKSATPPVPPAATPPAPPATPAITSMTDEPWPTDIAAAVFDEKSGLQKAPATETLAWGRDSEPAPTT